MTRTCEHCRKPLAIMARAHAHTCSPRCRKALSRMKARQTPAIPAELTTRDRWVRYSARKVPLTTAGTPASSTDPGTWTSYSTAARSTAGAGLGFVLAGDGIVCIDLDHCLAADGTLETWAADIVAQSGATYTEVSPSGAGLHIWGRADVRHGRRIRRPGGLAVEVYGTGRYITMTGRRHGACPSTLADLSALVTALTQ
ncbi:bifunctional DNA primase/polymerase [Kitasatospora sp. MBT66]|uniref:bifunctional DNA primase/polymerase n=1 Tax=Kitasatospora sp. MBT66 TaxID=1444769 RepID=UPI0005BCEE59|nr:bifunctional DNA primase/polymerase [Kitasatospora sp. MBT66]